METDQQQTKTMPKTEHWEDNNCKEKQILMKLKLKKRDWENESGQSTIHN